jgi:Tol biopolymer transport system component
VVSGVAWSPDRTLIAYSLLHARPGDSAVSMEIYLVGSDGSAARPLAERDRPGTVLDMPTWSPDGRAVYFSAFGQSDGRTTQRIERVTLEDGQRSVVVEQAYAPAISPDGRTLLFVRDERAGAGLWRMPIDGGEPLPVLAPGRWPTIGVPRFSPDGSRVAVSLPESSAGQLDAPDPWGWLLPPVAYAHGDPADIWTFDLEGNNTRRLTHLSADEPMASWSSDGRYLVVWCEQGLFLVEAAGGEVRQMLDEGGYGTIDWRP